MSVAFHTISQHAVDALIDDWHDLSLHQSWLSLFWMYHHGHDASEYELALLNKQFEAEAHYRICESCYGNYVMVIRRGVMTTCYDKPKYYYQDRMAS